MSSLWLVQLGGMSFLWPAIPVREVRLPPSPFCLATACLRCCRFLSRVGKIGGLVMLPQMFMLSISPHILYFVSSCQSSNSLFSFLFSILAFLLTFVSYSHLWFSLLPTHTFVPSSSFLLSLLTLLANLKPPPPNLLLSAVSCYHWGKLICGAQSSVY